MNQSAPGRLPVYFISHGGGPWPWIMDQMPGDWTGLQRSLQSIPGELPAPPRAVLVVSAHWESPVFSVQGQARPQMYYDYGGFPEFTYHLQYPAPGSPEVAERVLELLSGAGLPAVRDDQRGFDHGMFAPMYVAWPEADVPMLQLSLRDGLDPAEHLALGRALAPLRDEGVLIIGSGVPTFHDLRVMGPAARKPATEFDGWLTETMTGHAGAERSRRLERWESAPSARRAHPREEHLLPGMVAVGAAEDEPGTVQYHEDDFMGWMPSSAYRLG